MGLSSGPRGLGQAGGGSPSFQWAALPQESLTWKRFCIQYVRLLGEFNTVHPPPLPESPGPVSSTAGAGWGKGALPDHAQTSGRDSGAKRPEEAKSTCPRPVLGAPTRQGPPHVLARHPKTPQKSTSDRGQDPPSELELQKHAAGPPRREAPHPRPRQLGGVGWGRDMSLQIPQRTPK